MQAFCSCTSLFTQPHICLKFQNKGNALIPSVQRSVAGMVLLPQSPTEDGHRGGHPWQPQLSDAVSMMPKNDWFRGSGRCSLTVEAQPLPHLGEETLAGCEMELNKVIPKVVVRPVTFLPYLVIEEFTAWTFCCI